MDYIKKCIEAILNKLLKHLKAWNPKKKKKINNSSIYTKIGIEKKHVTYFTAFTRNNTIMNSRWSVTANFTSNCWKICKRENEKKLKHFDNCKKKRISKNRHVVKNSGQKNQNWHIIVRNRHILTNINTPEIHKFSTFQNS